MSMLTRQAGKLRETAGEVKRIKDNGVGWLWCDAITLDDAVKEMREAADTIENLRNRLTETCRNADTCAEAGGMWHSPRFVCSECGAAYVMSDYARFCPSCGRRVAE